MKTHTGKRTLLLTVALVTALATAGAVAGMHGGAGAGDGGGMHQATPDGPRDGMMGRSGMGGMMQSCAMMRGGAHGMGGMMGQHSSGMIPGMMAPMDLSGADLTAEQREQARELRQTHREEHFQRMARMVNLREDMHALMQNDTPDPDAAQELHGRMAAVHGEILAENIRLRNAMREMLTQEQRETLRQAAPQDTEPGPEGDDHDDHH